MGAKIYVPAAKTWSFFSRNKDKLASSQALIADNDETNYSVCMTVENDIPMFTVFKGDQKIESEGAVDEDDCRDTAQRLFVKHLFPVTVVDEKAIPHGEQLHISEIDKEAWEYPEPQGRQTLYFPDFPEDDEFDLRGLDVEEEDDAWAIWKQLHEQISVPLEELDDPKSAEDVIYVRSDDVQQQVADLLDTLTEGDGAQVEDDLVDDVTQHLLQYLAVVHKLPIWYPMITQDVDTGTEMLETYPYLDMAVDHDECVFR